MCMVIEYCGLNIKVSGFIWIIILMFFSGWRRPSMWFHHVSQSPGDGGCTIAVNYCKDEMIFFVALARSFRS